MADLLTQAQRDSLWEYLSVLDRRTLRRAQEYAAAGRVLSAQVESDLVLGRVQGSSEYEVELSCSDSKWTGSCDCPIEIDCKHCGALAISVISASRAATLRAADASERFAPLAKPSRTSFREGWAPRLAEKLGRPLTTDEGHALGRLSALFTEFKSRAGHLYRDALLRHGFAVPAAERRQAYEPVYAGWWDPARPPNDPWELWQYLAADLEIAGREIPEAFRPMTNTGAIRTEIEERLITAEVERWRQVVEASARPSRPPPRIAGLLLRWTGSRWQLEVRASPDKPFKPATHAWLRTLARDLGPGDFASLPPEQAMLGTMVIAASSASGVGVEYGDLADLACMVVASPVASGAVMLPHGPWRVEPGRLAWQAEVDPSRPSRVQFHLVGPEGDAVVDATVLLGDEHETLYYWRERVYRGPPPMPAREAPLRVLDDHAVRKFLRTQGVRLPDSWESKTRHVPLRPRLECSLGGPEGIEPNLLVVRLAGVADDPVCEQRRTPSGWAWVNPSAPPPRKPGELFIEYDFEAADAVVPRFVEFRLSWFDYYEGWVRPLTRNFPEEFMAWRATLPPELEVLLAPELAGFNASGIRASLDLKAHAVEGGQDWFDVSVALRVEDTTLTADEIAILLRARGKWVRLPRLGFRRLEVAAGGPAAEALDRLGLSAGDIALDARPTKHRLHALQLAGEADALGDAALVTALRERAAALTRVTATLPTDLRAELRPYQREGFEFLAFLASNGFGGVLADDMGLGKTVQTLAWLLWLASRKAAPEPASPATKPARRSRKASSSTAGKGDFRALVVCPKSVVHGWIAETARFASTLPTVQFTPALAEGKTPPAGLTVANYAQLRLHAAWFQKTSWDAVVLDEGQFIKNPTSQIAGVARGLISPHRLVLTGTPIENRLLDLWSLFAFAQPGLLGPQAEFRRQYPAGDTAAHARLRRRTRHFLLRRTKGQVATDLPPRTEDELRVEMAPEQEKLYRAELKRARQHLLGVQTDRALDRVRFNILASLLRLRQICCHPALVDPAHADLPSAKLDALLERLEELRDEGHQVLVFSQFVEMLELIRQRLVQAEIGHLMLTGATENRAALVEEFQRDRTRTVFLLSLKAAGFGLNLTAASYAVLYDPWWNPAVEAQAIDRTHRIGQTKPVIAYRLIARDTVEEKIRALQADKAALARDVVQEESLASVLDLDSLRRILA